MVSDLRAFDEQYYDQNRQLGDRPALWFYARLTQRWLGPGPILDFGCGTGFLLRRLKQRISVAGLELSEFCRVRLNIDLPNVTVYEDVSTLPVETFSGIVALHVFEHIPDHDLTEILAKLRLSLKPGGRILCVMPDVAGRGKVLKGENWSAYRDPTHVNLKSYSEWQNFFVLNGFRILRCGTDGLWDFPYKHHWPIWAEYCIYAWGTIFQFLLGRLILPVGSGESVVFLLQSER